MKKFMVIVLALLLFLSVVLGFRACGKPEEARIVFPFDPEDVENVELFHYENVPANAQKKLVTAPEDIKSLCDSFAAITCLKKETEALSGSPVYSFRFNLADGTNYELIYMGYGVKKGEILSPTAGFRYFTSADIGWKWFYLNEPLEALPAEAWELPVYEGWSPDREPAPVPTASEADPTDLYQEKIGEILRGREPFYSLDYDMPRYETLEDYCIAFQTAAEIPLTFTQAASVDMDGDGLQEIALNFAIGENTEAGLLLLHYGDGKIQGRTYYHRQMSHLKTDGTFMWSGSAGYNGVSRLVFGDAGWERQVIHQVDYDMTTTPYQYMVDEAEATKEEFDRAIDRQLAKESVTWVGQESILELFR